MFFDYSARIQQIEERLSTEGGPYSLDPIELEGLSCGIYRFGPKTLLDLCKRGFAMKPSTPLICAANQEFTYGAMFERVVRYSSALRQRNIVRGARVCIALPNTPEAFAFVLAVISLGAVAVLRGEGSLQCAIEAVERLHCDCLVYAAGEDLSQILINSEIPIREDRLFRFAELLDADDNCKWEPAAIEPDMDAIVAFTSGSTGYPKSVVLTHRSVVNGLMNMLFAGMMSNPVPPAQKSSVRLRGAQPGTLLLLPYFHVAGFTQLMLQILCGGRIVLGGSKSAEAIASAIERFATRSIVGLAPRQARALLQVASEFDLNALSAASFSGVSLQKGLLRSFSSVLPGVAVGISYGMTETGGAICALAGESLAERLQSCGRVVPAVRVKIADSTGEELPNGRVGQIYLGGAMLFRTYLGSTVSAKQNGWFATGDLGYLTPDRHLCVSDRWGEIRTSKRGSISCSQAEDELCTALDIDEIAVLPSELRAGGRPIVVAASGGGADFDTAQYRRSVCELLGDELPLELVEELPHTASGKIDKAKLAQDITGY